MFHASFYNSMPIYIVMQIRSRNAGHVIMGDLSSVEVVELQQWFHKSGKYLYGSCAHSLWQTFSKAENKVWECWPCDYERSLKYGGSSISLQ